MIMKFAEAVDLYKQYYDEYMNDPERKKLMNRAERWAQLLPTLALAGMGTIAGGGLGAAWGLSPKLHDTLKGHVSGAGAGAVVGGVTGGLLGWLLGTKTRQMQQEAMTQAMRDEAWRYAAMRSSRVDPGKTLV